MNPSEVWKSAQATLLDFSEPMLHAARKRLADPPQTEFLNLDYSSPSWTTHLHGPFDAIVSGFSIHHQPDPIKRRLYQQCFSLLSPGAMFLNLEHVSSPTPWLESLHDNLMIDCLHHLNPTQPRAAIESAYHNRPDKAANILAPLETQLQWLRDAGFTHVDCYLKIFELALFGGRA
jgi:tRNA (cmo5U34)-methyltransferase